MMIAVKHGVKISGLSPQMALAASVVASIYDTFRADCVITSANDSTHGTNSLHYQGRALDFRTKYDSLNGREAALRDAIAEALGPEFDVVLESLGMDNEHIHVEYDPK